MKSAEEITPGSSGESPALAPVSTTEFPEPIDSGAAAEIDLIRRAQSGDREAFDTLYRDNVHLVFRYFSFRVRDAGTVEDLTAEVFVRALKNIGGFRWRGSGLTGWLMRIARNILVDHLKSSGKRMEVIGVDLPEMHDKTTPGSDLEALDRLDREALYRGLNELKPRHQEVLYLRFLQGVSTIDTAAAMGISEGALRVLQFRALKALLTILQRRRTPIKPRTNGNGNPAQIHASRTREGRQ